MTLSGVESADFVSLVVVGANNDASAGNTLWTINGQTMTGETGVSLGSNDFIGSTATYVVESINPLDFLKVGVQLVNFNGDLPYVLKIEKNGKVEINESGALLSGGDFTKDYTF